MQTVITAVRNTVVDLKLAIDGTIIMSETLRDALDSIYDGRIPSAWKKVGSVGCMCERGAERKKKNLAIYIYREGGGGGGGR